MGTAYAKYSNFKVTSPDAGEKEYYCASALILISGKPEHKLERQEAYMLCNVAGDPRTHEVARGHR